MSGPPSDNLFMTGFPVGMDDSRLKEVMGPYGNIMQVKIMPAAPGKSTAAMVRYATVDEATWIVENLNGNIPQGLSDPVQVKFANSGGGASKGGSKGPYAMPPASGKMDFSKVMAGKDGKDGKGKGKGKGKPGIRTLVQGLGDAGALPGGQKWENDENTLFVGGLPHDTTDCDLYRIFSPFGAIAPQGVRAMVDRDTGICKGIGFVNYMSAQVAHSAIATLNGTMMPDGTWLTVSQKRDGGGKGKMKF